MSEIVIPAVCFQLNVFPQFTYMIFICGVEELSLSVCLIITYITVSHFTRSLFRSATRSTGCLTKVSKFCGGVRREVHHVIFMKCSLSRTYLAERGPRLTKARLRFLQFFIVFW